MSKKVFDGSTMLAPLPAVMVSVGDMQNSNIITIAWTGIVCSKPARTYVSIRPDRYSYDIVNKTKQFVINLTTKDLVASADFCGIRSGKDVDKFSEMNLTKEKASKVDCPLIAESPINLECVVFDQLDLGTHTMFLADIVAVDVDERVIIDGKIDFEKCGFANYQHGEYYATGKHLARFGFATQRKFIRLNGKGTNVKIDNAKYTKRKSKKQ